VLGEHPLRGKACIDEGGTHVGLGEARPKGLTVPAILPSVHRLIVKFEPAHLRSDVCVDHESARSEHATALAQDARDPRVTRLVEEDVGNDEVETRRGKARVRRVTLMEVDRGATLFGQQVTVAQESCCHVDGVVLRLRKSERDRLRVYTDATAEIENARS